MMNNILFIIEGLIGMSAAIGLLWCGYICGRLCEVEGITFEEFIIRNINRFRAKLKRKEKP